MYRKDWFFVYLRQPSIPCIRKSACITFESLLYGKGFFSVQAAHTDFCISYITESSALYRSGSVQSPSYAMCKNSGRKGWPTPLLWSYTYCGVIPFTNDVLARNQAATVPSVPTNSAYWQLSQAAIMRRPPISRSTS